MFLGGFRPPIKFHFFVRGPYENATVFQQKDQDGVDETLVNLSFRAAFVHPCDGHVNWDVSSK